MDFVRQSKQAYARSNNLHLIPIPPTPKMPTALFAKGPVFKSAALKSGECSQVVKTFKHELFYLCCELIELLYSRNENCKTVSIFY